MEEIWKALGGLPGVFAVVVAGAALFWRFKFPQIGLDYLKAELDRNRAEIAIADQERKKLREELQEFRDDMADLERRYQDVLQEKEIIAYDLRQCKRLIFKLRGDSKD